MNKLFTLCLLWLFASACGPVLIAYPPPSPMIGALETLPEGEGSVTAGVVGLPVGEGGGLGVTGNLLGGPIPGSVGLGLPQGMDIRVTGARTLEGPTGSVQLSRIMKTEDGRVVSLLGGLGASLAHERSYDYRYGSIAPYVGARTITQKTDTLALAGLVRASYSLTYKRSGLDEQSQMPYGPWIELAGGLIYTPWRGLRIGAGLHYTPWPNYSVPPWISLSVGYRFAVFSPRGQPEAKPDGASPAEL